LLAQLQANDLTESLEVLRLAFFDSGVTSEPLARLLGAFADAAAKRVMDTPTISKSTRKLLAEFGVRTTHCEHIIVTDILELHPTLHLAREHAHRLRRQTDDLQLVCGQTMLLQTDSSVWTRATRGDWRQADDCGYLHCRACALSADEFEETHEMRPQGALGASQAQVIYASACQRLHALGLTLVRNDANDNFASWPVSAYGHALTDYIAAEFYQSGEWAIRHFLKDDEYTLLLSEMQGITEDRDDLASLLREHDWHEIVGVAVCSTLPPFANTSQESSFKSFKVLLTKLLRERSEDEARA
jgi:hypothetical protein